MQLKMTIDEAIDFAREWSRGTTLQEDSQGWRVVCMLLADEVEKLRAERKAYQHRLQRASRTGHHCDASIAADAVAQSMLAHMRSNAQ